MEDRVIFTEPAERESGTSMDEMNEVLGEFFRRGQQEKPAYVPPKFEIQTSVQQLHASPLFGRRDETPKPKQPVIQQAGVKPADSFEVFASEIYAWQGRADLIVLEMYIRCYVAGEVGTKNIILEYNPFWEGPPINHVRQFHPMTILFNTTFYVPAPKSASTFAEMTFVQAACYLSSVPGPHAPPLVNAKGYFTMYLQRYPTGERCKWIYTNSTSLWQWKGGPNLVIIFPFKY